MLETRYEQYGHIKNGLPFVVRLNIKRNRLNQSRQTNWHENLELQFCAKGSGYVLTDGKKYPFNENETVAVNSNVIHYTSTDSELIYDVIIIDTDFCIKMGFDMNSLCFETVIKSEKIAELLLEFKKVYSDSDAEFKTARLIRLLLEILIELAQRHSAVRKSGNPENKSYDRVKQTILYIRNNYRRKITLDDIARTILVDKYTLCKEFKKYTGQTVFENLNRYRCMKAVDCLAAGFTVGEAASDSGFDNFSFFTKTFKKYIGRLPSEYKKQIEV